MDNELTRQEIEDIREGGPQVVTNSAWQALIRMALAYLDAKAELAAANERADQRIAYEGKTLHEWRDRALAAESEAAGLRERVIEECAKACEVLSAELTYQRDSQGACDRCADAIRALTTKQENGNG